MCVLIKNEMEKLDYILTLIQKYLRNDISPEEQSELQEWLNLSDENKLFLEQYKDIWNRSKTIPSQLFDIDVEEELQKFNKKVDSRRILDLSRFSYWAIAAAAMIVVVLFLFKPKTYEYSAKEDFVDIILPDNSQVFISPHTSIVYKKSIFSSKRNVYLRGDAFFEVQADENHPFVVDAIDFQVVVKGTKFLVSQSQNSVSVRNGVVEVKNNAQSIVLKANEQATINKNITICQIADNFSLNNVFEEIKILDKNLLQVAQIVEKIFGQKIVLSNKELENLKINFTISQNQTLDSVLEVIALTLDLKISKDQNNYYLQRK